MRITIEQLKRIIKEEVGKEAKGLAAATSNWRLPGRRPSGDDSDRHEFLALNFKLATDPDTSPEVLDRLASDISDEDTFALEVAGNPSASEETLRRLKDMKYDKINYRLALNPSTPQDILEELAAIDDYGPRGYSWLVAMNPSASPETFRSMFRVAYGEGGKGKRYKNRSHHVLDKLSKNPSIPDDVKEKLRSSRIPGMRARMAGK